MEDIYDTIPLLLSVVDENALNNSQDKQWYLTKNIHYIFDDDDNIEEEEHFNAFNVVPEEDNTLHNSVTQKDTDATKGTVIMIDLDENFSLQHVDLISNEYQLLEAYNITETSQTLHMPEATYLSATEQTNGSSKDIELKILSKFNSESKKLESFDLDQLLQIYKTQNQQLLTLLDLIP